MLKETIKYQDYDGNDYEEDFYFNLNKSELIKLQTSIPGGLEQMIKNIIAAIDQNALMNMFSKIIHISYGEKSPDGKHFVKSEEIANAFEQTLAYDNLFMELINDADKAAAFINGILPADSKSEVKALSK